MGVLSGVTVVFTGRMSKKRPEMEREAQSLGASAESGVTRRTKWLVTGKKAGKTKMNAAARQPNCEVMTEDQYRQEIQFRQEDDAEREASAPPPRVKTVEHPEWAKQLRNPRSIRF